MISDFLHLREIGGTLETGQNTERNWSSYIGFTTRHSNLGSGRLGTSKTETGEPYDGTMTIHSFHRIDQIEVLVVTCVSLVSVDRLSVMFNGLDTHSGTVWREVTRRFNDFDVLSGLLWSLQWVGLESQYSLLFKNQKLGYSNLRSQYIVIG